MVEQPAEQKPRLRFNLTFLLLLCAFVAVVLTVAPRLYDWYFAVPTVPLAEAVRLFNAEAANHPVGKHERPITEAEIVASIRSQLLTLTASKKATQVYREIADTGRLPHDASLHFLPGYTSADGTSYTVWWINLDVILDDNGGGFGLRIRENNHPEAKPDDEPVLRTSNP